MFRSYLSGRQQRVYISGLPSAWLYRNVWHNTIIDLGFIIINFYYNINDLLTNVQNSQIALFAVDWKNTLSLLPAALMEQC